MRTVIIGGVAGGAGVAARLRRNDESAEIALLEKGEFISFANCGLPYYVGGVIADRDALKVQTAAGFSSRFGVDVRQRTEAVSIDPVAGVVRARSAATGEDLHLPYDRLVLAPGSRPVLPPLPGIGSPKVHVVRTIPDADGIVRRAAEGSRCVVVGAGFIGLELAENLRLRGLDVEVVEAGAHVLPPLDADMAAIVHGKLADLGIGLRLGARCAGILEDGVELEGGARLPADFVVMCVGVAPDTRFLEGSGIELGRRGEILVDDSMRTNLPGVYALGDAVSVRHLVSGKPALIPLAGPANKQARIVADALCGKAAAYKGSAGTAVMKLADLTIATVGMGEEALAREGIPFRKTITCSPDHATYYPGASTMDVKLLYAPGDGRILGAQAIGRAGADKRIDVVSALLGMGGTVRDLAEFEQAYAPPFSSAKDPANMAGFVACNVLDGTMKPFYAEDVEKLAPGSVLVDVRTPEEYAAGNIAGSRNIPLDQLRSRLGELPKDRFVHITCQIGLRGYLAQRILEQSGFDTRNLSGGYRFYSAYARGRRCCI